MRDLAPSEKNVLVIQDAVSGGEVELYYRTPTTSERAAFEARLMKRKGQKVVIQAYQTRLVFGLKIMTGFREGDYGIDGQPIASDPQSPHYREDWKDLVVANAPEHVTALAQIVFEGARFGAGIELEFEGAEEETLEEKAENEEAITEDAVPFERSSGD